MRAFAIGLVLAAAALSPSVAGATEHVQDGSFEASSCDATECTNPVWTKTVTTAFANATGPICRVGVGSGNTACSTQGSAPFGGSTWARLGAGFTANFLGAGVLSSIQQTVPIPTAPATLSFRLRIINAAGPTGDLKVEVGGTDDTPGTEVFAVTDATSGFASYAPVTVDLSSFAGASRLLHFQGISSQNNVMGPLDSFDVDDVSLTTVDPVDPRCANLRAKLKKAKAKHKKRKVRKIRKKLRALGC